MLENVANDDGASFASNADNLRQRVEIRLSADETGACTHIEYLANGTPIASGEQLDKYRPSRLVDWDILRIVRNGVLEPDEMATMTIMWHVTGEKPDGKVDGFSACCMR